MNDPRDVAALALARFQLADWAGVVELIDAEDLAQFHRPPARAVATIRSLAAEDIKQIDPNMPDAVAEYMAADYLRVETAPRGPEPQIVWPLAGPEYQALPADQAMIRFLAANNTPPDRPSLDRAVAAAAGYPALAHARTQRTLIGLAVEDADNAHAIYRVVNDYGGQKEFAELQVMSLRKSLDAWRIRTSCELFWGRSPT